MELTVKLQVFEGPLDLLLHLLEKNKVNIYDGYSLYRKKNFKFNDMTFMQPKATFENDLVFLIHPYELQEKDMQILQEDVRFHVDLDSNPILFFMRY